MAKRKSQSARKLPGEARGKGKGKKGKAKGGAARPTRARGKPSAPSPRTASQPIGANASQAAKWTPAAGEVGIRVRMYRVGFGDFFLLSLAQDNKQPLHIIIDCGVFKGTSQTGDIGSIEAAVNDMAQTTGGTVALIIMTHRHADHIAGFARHADVFKRLKVGGVWMPIWESEYSPAAMKFQAELTRAASLLQQHFSALGAAASAQQVTARQYMENATGENASQGGGSNAAALELLKRGFSGVTPDYYTGGDQANLPPPLVAAGLTARILGPPPVSDMALMKLMDLKKGVGQYLAAGLEAGGSDQAVSEPFGAKWVINPFHEPEPGGKTDLARSALREWVGGRRWMFDDIPLTRARAARKRMERSLKACQPEAALVAAKQLNSFLNNQSLVVLFEYKGKRLLFVGDAQAGNWEHWHIFFVLTAWTAGGLAACLAVFRWSDKS